jgi:hypothetical protein
VELRPQLVGSGRLRAEGIDLNGEVPVTLDRADERRGSGSLPQKRRVDTTGANVATGELSRKPEKLTPGLVNRRRIALVRLVGLRDVTVVEDAGDRKAGHDWEI